MCTHTHTYTHRLNQTTPWTLHLIRDRKKRDRNRDRETHTHTHTHTFRDIYHTPLVQLVKADPGPPLGGTSIPPSRPRSNLQGREGRRVFASFSSFVPQLQENKFCLRGQFFWGGGGRTRGGCPLDPPRFSTDRKVMRRDGTDATDACRANRAPEKHEFISWDKTDGTPVGKLHILKCQRRVCVERFCWRALRGGGPQRKRTETWHAFPAWISGA